MHYTLDVKPNLVRKARLVAGGHLTDPPDDSVYSGVVSLCSLCIVTFLAELNGLNLMAADVQNAYLRSKTKEKVYIIANHEFGDLQGHTLLIDKALYGLHTSGACSHDKLFDTLAAEGWKPCFADSDV